MNKKHNHHLELISKARLRMAITEMRPIDTLLFRLVFDKNKECCYELVHSYFPQISAALCRIRCESEEKNPNGRKCRFDLRMDFDDGSIVIIEAQNREEGFPIERIEYYLSTLVTRALPQKADYKAIPFIGIAIITEGKEGKDVPFVETFALRNENGSKQGRSQATIYRYRYAVGNDPSAIMTRDLFETDPHKISNKHIAKSVYALKYPREGEETMMSEFEKLILEVQEKAAEMARKEATEKTRKAAEKASRAAEKARKATEKARKATEKAKKATEKQTVGLSRRLSEASFLTDEQRLQLFGGTMEEYQKALAKSRKRA